MSLWDKIKEEITDDGGKPKPPKHVANAAVHPSTPIVSPYDFGVNPNGSLAPITAPSAPYVFQTPGVIDPDAMKAVTDGVFTTVGGHSSRYLMFVKINSKLNNVAMAIETMQAVDPTITASVILDDINAHLSLLDQVTKNAETTFQSIATERLGGADQKIKELKDLNDKAQAEILRHQTESAERVGQISTLTAERATSESQIGRAQASAQAAEDVVKTQLLAAQQLLSTLS